MEPASKHPWRIAHRGAPTKEPENTRASFERGLAEGANGIELDLCVTRDGEVIVWHDWSPGEARARVRRWGWEPAVAFRPFVPRGALRRSIRELELDDVLRHYGYATKHGRYARIASAPIVTLEEFLRLAAGARSLDVVFFDIKVPPDALDVVPRLMARVAELRAQHPHPFHPVFETAHPQVLDAMKAIAPEAHFALDVGPLFGVRPSAVKYSAVKQAILHGTTCATPERPRSSCFRPFHTYRRIARHDVKLRDAHNAARPEAPVRKIVAFTINHPVEMRELLELGFDGVQTDRPDLLARVVSELGERAPRQPATTDARHAAPRAVSQVGARTIDG
jgi:glycerophosphoryl diester phosphodiesterase